MLKEEVAEKIVNRRRGGESVPPSRPRMGWIGSMIRAWRERGGYRGRVRRESVSMLERHAEWLRNRASEVEYNAAVLYRELRDYHGYTGSARRCRR